MTIASVLFCRSLPSSPLTLPPPPLLTSSQALLAARRRPGGRSIAPLAPGGAAAARSSAARAPPAPSGAAAAADRTAQRRAPTRSWRRGGRVCSAPCVSRPEVTGGVDAQLGAREDGRACFLCVLAPDGVSSGAGDCSPRPLGTLSPLNTTINLSGEATKHTSGGRGWVWVAGGAGEKGGRGTRGTGERRQRRGEGEERPALLRLLFLGKGGGGSLASSSPLEKR